MEFLIERIADNWVMWAVSVTLVVAAVIDGLYLKVPNKITYPLIIAGWIYSTWAGASVGLVDGSVTSVLTGGLIGLGWSLLSTLFGLILLFGLHAIGGMGAGDVKLLAGIAAFVHIEHTWWIFVATVVVGGIIAFIQIAWSGQWWKHYFQAQEILKEIATVRDADKLYELSQNRKSKMLLLPYGIPMTIAAIGYFAFAGLLY